MDNITRLIPMRMVAQRTGLSSHVIRAWEKRYQAIEPHRTETNRRLYSQKDVDRLTMLRQLTQHGHSISSIAQLDDDELRDRLSEVLETLSMTQDYVSESLPNVQELLSRCCIAIQDYDREALEEVLLMAQVELSQPQLLEELIGPLLKWVGEGWHNGSIRIAQEQIATAGIRNFLGNIQLMRNVKNTLGNIVLATPSEQDHEFGALMASIAAASQGWRCIYLGTRLPPQEIAIAASKTNASVVALSITSFEKIATIQQELNTLCNLLPKDITIIVGGTGIEGQKERFEEQNILVAQSIKHFTDLISDEFIQGTM